MTVQKAQGRDVSDFQAAYVVAQNSIPRLNDIDILRLNHGLADGQSRARVSAGALPFMTELVKLQPHSPRSVYTFISFATGGYYASPEKRSLRLARPAASAPARGSPATRRSHRGGTASIEYLNSRAGAPRPLDTDLPRGENHGGTPKEHSRRREALN